MVTALLVVAVLASATVLTWTSRHALLLEAETQGRLLARLLAITARFASEVTNEVEGAIGEQMIVEATIAAHLVALAETAGLPTDVAVTVEAFVAPFAAVAGTATFTQTSVGPPAGMLEVVVMDVVQVESKKLTVQPAVTTSYWARVTSAGSRCGPRIGHTVSRERPRRTRPPHVGEHVLTLCPFGLKPGTA